MGVIDFSLACAHALIRFCYPPFCLHCRKKISQETYFCSSCQADLIWIDPQERCRKCLSFDIIPGKSLCQTCHKNPQFFHEVSAAFDATPPMQTLISKMKTRSSAFLAEDAASFLYAQWVRLAWPTPDFIIPVPLSWDRHFKRGFNQSENLAKGLAAYLNCRSVTPLKRKAGSFSQTGLSMDQRRELFGFPFYLKKSAFLKGKRLLVIDDLYVTGTTLNRTAEALLLAQPSAIYGLTLCHFSC